jgi:hypothetical protein
MAYVRSLREIPLDEEPHASVLAALLPDPTESPYDPEVDWANISAHQLRHLQKCPACAAVLGGIGQIAISADAKVDGR